MLRSPYLLGICLLAIAAGAAIAYNIRNYEPIQSRGGIPDRIENIAEWFQWLAERLKKHGRKDKSLGAYVAFVDWQP